MAEDFGNYGGLDSIVDYINDPSARQIKFDEDNSLLNFQPSAYYKQNKPFKEDGTLNIPTQAAANYIAKQGQVTASQPQDDSWLSSVLSLNQKLGQGIYDVGHGLVHGVTVGAANINKLIPGATWLANQAGQTAKDFGLDTTVSKPKGIVGGLASGVGQALPGIVPAVSVLRTAGYGTLAADVIGGFIGDFASSGKDDAKGISSLIGMIPGESAKAISNSITDFVKSDNTSFEDFKSRLVAAVPGAVFTPVVNGLARYVMKLKNSSASDNLLNVGVATDDLLGSMKTRWSEGKSPIPMGLSIENVATKQATDLDPQGFYSEVSRAVDALPMEKGGGSQMRAMIAKSPGVKAEEMSWTGLDDFLAGKKSVTKAEIKEFTDANQVRVEEIKKTPSGGTGEPESLTWGESVVDDSFEAYSYRVDDIEYEIDRGDDSFVEYVINQLLKDNPKRYPEIDPNGGISWANKLRDHFDEGGTVSNLDDKMRGDVNNAIDGIAKAEYMDNPYFTVRDDTGRYIIYGNNDIGYNTTRRSDGAGINDFEIYSLEEAKIDAYLDGLDQGYIGYRLDEGDTLFSEWKLPGGENYREVLLTLPENKGFNVTRYEELKQKDIAGKLNDLEEVKEFNTLIDHKKSGVFTQGHFDEPNVLAHIRLDDRTGPDGERILFVEEIQSDWHQMGREKGYLGTEKTYSVRRADTTRIDGVYPAFSTPTEAEAYLEKLPKFKTTPKVSLEERVSDNGLREYRLLSDDGEAGGLWRSDRAEVEAAVEKQNAKPDLEIEYRIVEETENLRGSVPDAPLKKTWEQTALRRVIRMAAEEGYDSVAWTPGNVQNARYSLSDKIEAINYDPDAQKLLAYEKGKYSPVINEIISKDKLADRIGKDAAEKLLATKRETIPTSAGSTSQHSLEGLDLEVGGEGMRGFYDKELVNYAKKFGKKFDAKVGTTKIQTDGPASVLEVVENQADGFTVVDKVNGGQVRDFRTRAEAEQFIQNELVDTEVWTIPITPKMRDSVIKKGIPLFSAGGLAVTAGTQEQDSNGL